MNITVIGASAGVGLATIKRALELGHRVTTLSRRKVVNVPNNDNLNPILGSALVEQDLKQAINGADALLVTLGRGNDTSATTLFSDFAKLLLKIHAQKAIQIPVIILTGFGSGNSRPYMPWFVRPLFELILGKVYMDKAMMEDMISGSDLRWEFVRPGILTNRPLTQNYRVETELRPNLNIRLIPRADVADYIVKEAAAPINIHKYPALTGN